MDGVLPILVLIFLALAIGRTLVGADPIGMPARAAIDGDVEGIE